MKFVVVLNLPAILNLIWPGHPPFIGACKHTTSVEHSIVTMLHSTHIIYSTYSFKSSAAIDGIVSIVQWSMSTLSSVIIIPHEYYMILPVIRVSAASVYYLALALHVSTYHV